jgi:hypothetical protein
MKDFYYILGTSKNATSIEIDAAYQKLARKFLYDGDEDEFIDSHFREITEAYDVLRDGTRRRKYDAAFRQNQTRRLAPFKIKYLNIAVTLTFLAVTALFANYVISSIRGNGHKKAPPVIVAQPTPSVVAAIHPKKYHHAVAIPVSKPTPAHDTIAAKTTPPIPAVMPTVAPDSTYTAKLHANITGIVYLHQSADYSSAVLAKIPDASQVRVLQKSGAYDKVMYDGQVGYVLRSSVGER